MRTIEIKSLRTGDILLYRSNHLLGKLIRFFTRSTVNHAGIVVELWGELFVAESEAKGFVLNRVADSIRGRDILVRRHLISVNTRSFAILIAGMVGKHRYDYFSLLFFQVVYAVTGKWIGKEDKHASKRLYCSEAVAYIYNKEISIMRNWWEYTPKMLLKGFGFDTYQLK